MKKLASITTALAFVLVAGAVPLAAQAQSRDGGYGHAGVTADIRASVGVRGGTESGSASTSMSARLGARERMYGGPLPDATSSRGAHATSTLRAREELLRHAPIQAREHSRSFLFLSLESTSTTPVQTLAELQQTIQQRRHELDLEASSTATSTRDILRHEGGMSVAVHAFLAAKDLLGKVGPEVSQVAKEINQSLATTSSAEAQIQTRGFWSTLFFGGDAKAATAINQAVTQNQLRIQALSKLLAQASTSASISATLDAQVQAMQQEQVRLQALAKQQASLWGIFSWRL